MSDVLIKVVYSKIKHIFVLIIIRSIPAGCSELLDGYRNYYPRKHEKLLILKYFYFTVSMTILKFHFKKVI